MRPRRGPVRADELEGYLDGVARRYRERQAEHGRDPEIERSLGIARDALHREDWTTADDALRSADERLDALRIPPELSEWPRGLSAYTAVGSKGVPPERDEEPVANYLLVVERLLTVARAHSIAVDDLVTELDVAHRAYDAGEKVAARRAAERIHAELDRRIGRGRAPET